MMAKYPRRVPEPRSRPSLSLPTRRAIVVGAGSFGTAVAVLLARGGFRTTLQTRTPEQARVLLDDRENRIYLPGVDLPKELRIETSRPASGARTTSSSASRRPASARRSSV